jgi:hypothetical protein
MSRIYEQRGGPDHMRWCWSLYGMFGKPADMRTDGHAATLDEAKAQFETAGHRWLAWAKLSERGGAVADGALTAIAPRAPGGFITVDRGGVRP